MPTPPLLTADPRSSYLAQAEEIRAAIDRVLVHGHYILGPEVEAFEQEFATAHGGGFAVGVANGTDAITLALRALGVGPGAVVATVANTVSATAAGIAQSGARLVFVEIDPTTMTMSPAALAAVLEREGGAVQAVVPVHLYGHPAAMPAILEVARRYGAKVVEDCAQSHGAVVAGRPAGTWGDAAAYSFYPTKNLGALGDGGAVFTQDVRLAERIRSLRQYGWRQRYVSEEAGSNSRLDELQAAVLRVKLRRLEADNALRRTLATRYLARLGDAIRAHSPGAAWSGTGVPPVKGRTAGRVIEGTEPLRLPTVAPDVTPVWHQFTIRCAWRDALNARLADCGIRCGVLYPTPLHRQPAYAQPELSLPETERACAEVLCLPVHPAVTVADVDRVVDELLRGLAP